MLTEILHEEPEPMPIPPILEADGTGVLIVGDMDEVILMSMMAHGSIKSSGKIEEDVEAGRGRTK